MPVCTGANQCIIVRDSETKKSVRLEFPTALVMTVEECKGLEFEDCIIYNFFSDSPADAHVWNILCPNVSHRPVCSDLTSVLQ